MMNETTDHLGVLLLGHMWNHPLQQINDLLAMRHPEQLAPELVSGLRKLTTEEKRALKHALVSIFSQDFSEVCEALDEGVRRGEVIEISDREHAFSRHLPPWNDRLSYFDKEGNPKAEFVR